MARVFSAPIIGQSAASGAQVIDGSLRFDDGNKHHLLRTHTAGDTRTFTWAGWVKRDKYGGYQTIFGHVSGGSGQHYIDFGSDKIRFTRYVSSNEAALETTAVFRDTGWYHIVAIWDTTNATANDRQRLYVNGEQITDFSTRVNPSQNYAGAINTAIQHGICRIPTLDQNYNACRMSQAYFIDGRALGPEYFGFTDPLTNTWKPKKFDIRAENNPNNGTTWSNLTTASSGSFEGSLPKTNLFDGIASNSNRANLDTVGASIDIDFSSNPIGVKNTISIWSGKASLSYSINGGAYVTYSDAQEAYKDIPFTGTLTSLSLKKSDEGAGASAIKIDGYVLLDGASDNSFYLPFDGNSLIGKDQSGNGHDWTPKNFGGSVALDSPAVSGARPILNTTPGGTLAGYGVFGSNENKFYTVTTANGSVYQFDLTSGDNPSLDFIRGATYRFDYTSFSSHPLRFSSTNPDSSTTAYTQGTNTSVSNVITITVPHDAPDTLYYYCTAHASAMNGAITVTTDNTKADQYASSCVLALPLVGIASDVCASIACTSSTKSITSNGDAAASSAQSNFYSGSFEFDGTGDYLTLANSSNFSFGSGDFTIEAYVRWNDLSGTGSVLGVWQSSDTRRSWLLQCSGSNTLSGLLSSDGNSGGSIKQCDATGALVANKWHHCAFTRSGNNIRLFLDGKLQATTDVTGFSVYDNTNDGLTIGSFRNDGAGDPIDGYIQDVRIYKGVAKYTSDFIVPSTSPDILPDTPSGVVGDSKLTKITEGAVSFDGSGDYLRNTSLDPIGTSDYTIECFFYLDHIAGTRQYIWDGRNSSSGKGTYLIKNQANNWFWTPDNSTSNDNALPLEAIPVNRWTHVAFVRESGTGKMYVDGILKATLTSHGGNLNSDTVTVGAAFDDTVPMTGQISNYRIIKGTALYTSNFTPPTRPLTEVTNTKLLCCQSNTQPGAAVTSPTMGGINNGTNWTHFLTTNAGDNFDASGPKYYAFDGNGSNKAYTGNNSDGTTQGVSYLQVNFPDPISGALRVKCDNGNEVINVSGQDVGIGTQSTGSDNQFVDCGTVSNLTNLRVLMAGGSRPAISIVEVDGVNLVDPLTPIGNVKGSNFNPFNTDIKTVRGQETGYNTFNPLLNRGNNTLSNGNTFVTGGSNWNTTLCTGVIESGKWFVELTHKGRQSASDNDIQFGLFGLNNSEDPYPLASTKDLAAQSTGYVIVDANAQWYNNSSSTSYGTTWSTPGDVVGLRYNADTGKLGFIINGVDQGDISTTLSTSQRWVVGISLRGGGAKAEINFGQKPFKFPPPDDFQLLNTANVRPETVITRPDQYVGIVTYMGAGGTKKVDGLNFSPDMVWVKALTSDFFPMLGDSVRGFSETTMLSPANNAEEDRSTDPTDGSERGYISAKNNRGFTVVDGSGTSQVNGSGVDYVAWCWKAGGNSGNFNIDHVGYSTAGDAAMSIADQNTTGYNTDQNWGAGATGEINPGGGALNSGCFNGDFSDNINSKWGDTSKAITFTFDNLPFKKLRFYAVAQNVSNSYVRFNGVAQTQARIGYGALKFGWFEAVDVPSPLNKIEVYTNGSSDFISLYAVEVDGKILVNNNITPPNLPSIPATGASVGTEQGFSIVTYTGTGSAGTIPHRLTQDPEFVIFKQRNNQDDWRVFHKDLDSDEAQDYYLILQLTNAKSADQNASFMNRVPPTGPVIHLGTDSAINGSSTTMVAYSWHSVPGLQKFGTFTGNSNADGPFVELGFRPALLWVKRTDSTGNWVILTAKRSPFNPVLKSLYADSSDDEYTPGQQWADLLSNGFKIRATYGEVNVGTYVYCAWAEAPSIDLFGGGANAR